MTQPIMPFATYVSYRRHCVTRGYCDPFIPYVGDRYGDQGPLKLVYCGGAARWAESRDKIRDDAEALAHGAELTRDFVAGGMYSAPFWRLFRQVAAITPGLANEVESLMLRRFAWTNLSKTGIVNRSAPPDNDPILRDLDVIQFNHEMDMLRPDLLMCVSGSLLTTTAYTLFDSPGWLQTSTPALTTEKTSARRTPWGGWLLWTMHPAYKTRAWFDSIVKDTAMVIATIKNEREAL